ncbi:MAG: TonB-dependent receptor, partial [Verrucomicrobiota bacterium]
NNSYFRYIERETLSSYYYSEIIDPSFSIENRTELRGNLEPGEMMRWRYNTGTALRYQFVEAYNDFFTEPAAVWDLTRDRNYINIYNSATFPNPFTSVPVPGWPNRYFTPDNGDSGISEAIQVGPFLQNDIKLWDRLSVIAGGRADLLSVDYLMEWNNPAGFNRLADNTTVVLPSVNASLVWDWKQDLGRDLSSYFTYNWNQNPAGAIGNGGSITTQGGPGFTNGALRTEAELFEAGTKWGFLDGHAFLNLSAFAQNRVNVNSQSRQQAEFQTMGVEFEGNFQPNRNLYVTLGYSYLDSRVKYDDNGALFDVGNTTLTPVTDRFFLLPDPGEIRRQGVPEHLFNLLVNYKLDCGFGMSANLVAHSDIWNNTVGTLVIPPQYTLDLSAYYIAKRWEARVFFLNVTDQWNWSAPNQVYGNESIVADLPFRVEGRVALKF